MRKLFLMSVFGLFMMVGLSSQPLTGLTLIPSAYASGDDDKDTPEFSCPEGVTTCYKAYTGGEDTESDGEYTDINNLPATAAGSEGEDDDGESLVSVVKPAQYRSF